MRSQWVLFSWVVRRLNITNTNGSVLVVVTLGPSLETSQGCTDAAHMRTPHIHACRSRCNVWTLCLLRHLMCSRPTDLLSEQNVFLRDVLLVFQCLYFFFVDLQNKFCLWASSVLLCDKLNCTTSAALIKLAINTELVTIQLVGLFTMTSL